MTYQEFVLSVLKSDKPSEQRFGQWAFNSLYEVRPDIADSLVGDRDFDPFYDDSNLYKFWVFVENAWNK